MPDGALFDDEPEELEHPSRAASEAQDDFPDNPVDPVEPCTPAPAKKKKAPPPAKPPCSAKTMQDNLAKCDGGTNVVADAKTANGGKDASVVVQKSVIQTGGSVDTTTGTVSIDPTPDCCKATQTLVQELSNLSHKKDFSDLASKAAAGDLAREDYTKSEERTEYDGVQKVLKAFDKCKSKWGCAKGASSVHQWARGAKDFDDYYQHRLGNLHKDYYRNSWDKNYKGAFDKKHPPAPPGPPPPPHHPAPTDTAETNTEDSELTQGAAEGAADSAAGSGSAETEEAPGQYAEAEEPEHTATEEGSNEEA